MNQSKPIKKDSDVKYIPPFGAELVNSALCVATITIPLCDTVNTGWLLIFFIKNTSFALLLISNEPVITALPEKGNVPPVPPFIAYDAVKANDAEVAVVELVANDAEVALTTLLIVIGNVVAFPLVNVMVALFTDAVSILNNERDAVNANDADVARNA
jgi:hypothetical protein